MLKLILNIRGGDSGFSGMADNFESDFSVEMKLEI